MDGRDLMAAFCGRHPIRSIQFGLLVYDNNTSTHELRYDTNWNWLMHVVDKIESLGSPVFISSNSCTIYERVDFSTNRGDWFVQEYDHTKIDATWKACVAYIKWYNERN
jgi:hypothetical protein